MPFPEVDIWLRSAPSQNEEASQEEDFDADVPPPRPLGLNRDPHAECEAEKVEGFELDELRDEQINRMIDPTRVGMKMQDVREQREAEEIQQVDDQHAEQREAAEEVKYRVSLGDVDRLPV